MIAFRADINSNIASGHLMRSITIAKKVRELGEEVLFISSDNGCASYLKENDLSYIVTNSPWNNWDQEISFIENLVKEYNIKCLFIDSYVVSINYLNALNKVVPIAYIDDILKQVLPVSLLIVPTQSRDLDYLYFDYQNTDTKLLLGKDYLIIRDEFIIKPEDNYIRDSIMITTGGSDSCHFTYHILQEILNHPVLSNEKYIVILGSLNQDESLIRNLLVNNNNFTILKNISNMGYYMKHSKYAISAGGNTIYELLCCKVPISCISLSDDQIPLAQRFNDMKLVSYEGDCRININSVISNCINSLMNHCCNHNNHNQSTIDYSDGLGAYRIATELINISK